MQNISFSCCISPLIMDINVHVKRGLYFGVKDLMAYFSCFYWISSYFCLKMPSVPYSWLLPFLLIKISPSFLLTHRIMTGTVNVCCKYHPCQVLFLIWNHLHHYVQGWITRLVEIPPSHGLQSHQFSSTNIHFLPRSTGYLEGKLNWNYISV